MIIDKLYESVCKKGCVCVGLDTDISYVPEKFIDKYSFKDDAMFRFNQKIIDATFEHAACYKVQIAYYEAMGIMGLNVYKKTLKYIKHIGGISIADIKRGDIAKTAEMYAKAHFTGDFAADFVTLSPYMGMDSIQPYLPYVKEKEKGLFILLRTSNAGAQDIQYIKDEHGKSIYNIVGDKISEYGKEYMGECGYSSVGAVVGCTHSEEAPLIRQNYKNTFFLIPGYGAQGGKAHDVAMCLKNGNGGIVNSSRAILLAYKKYENGEDTFDECALKEVLRMKDEINDAITL